ncbi:NUDIX domain-containing protein [Acidocella sp.]|uniref:NUDIX hydrolase n=1 Tax=Acidocella sp. TaxID=50710 RepID=UPI00262621B5|nr:NUDIX domain-containing protein [Acidocella sp.]
MASEAQIAKLIADIEFCHSAMLPGARLPLVAGPHCFGYVMPALAERLRAVASNIEISSAGVTMPEALLPRLNELAAAAGVPARAEDFDVRTAPEGEVLGVLDRGALPSFGVIGVGVHLNGLVVKPEGLHLWVAKRAATKKLDPGKLDHLVAGGVPAGHSPFAALLKEAWEEAGLDRGVAARAREVARFRYNMERPEGLRRDVIYAYDLELSEDFIPKPMDGEVESFMLWPLERVKQELLASNDFKFNVVLVLLDLLLRHGQFPPEEAALLKSALHRGI